MDDHQQLLTTIIGMKLDNICCKLVLVGYKIDIINRKYLMILFLLIVYH